MFPRMHYAKQGIITKEMQFISERENCNLENFLKTLSKEQLNKINKKHKGDFNSEIPNEYTPEFVRDEVARWSCNHSSQYQSFRV